MAEKKETFSRFFGERKPAAPTKRKNNEFVVIGLGRFGSSLAELLYERGHNVLAIDADATLVQRLSHTLPHVVQMDATNRDAYIELGVGNFDTGIVCIGTDFESNLLATVILRQLGVRRVICKARTRTQREILLKVGADEVILPEHEAGVRLGRTLSSVGFLDYMEVNEAISIVELSAPKNVIGKTLIESKLRQKYGVVVVAIRRGDKVISLPMADELIRRGDILVLLGAPNACDAMMEQEGGLE